MVVIWKASIISGSDHSGVCAGGICFNVDERVFHQDELHTLIAAPTPPGLHIKLYQHQVNAETNASNDDI